MNLILINFQYKKFFILNLIYSQCKTFYMINQLYCIICITFEVGIIKVKHFLMTQQYMIEYPYKKYFSPTMNRN